MQVLRHLEPNLKFKSRLEMKPSTVLLKIKKMSKSFVSQRNLLKRHQSKPISLFLLIKQTISMTKSDATNEYETILRQRKARSRLACLNYSKITKLAKTGTFGNLFTLFPKSWTISEELIAFHQKLYDLDLHAAPARKLEIPLSTQTSIHYFPRNNASFCLPPKSGSTNWLYTLEPLADEYRKDPFSRADFGPKSNIYQRLPHLTKDELSNSLRGVRKSRKILNARNPVSRLFSAWKDKFRFQQEWLAIWPITGHIFFTSPLKEGWRYEW